MRRYRAPGGAEWEAKVGYSRAVRCGAQVVVTGTTSFVAGGEAVQGDAYEQAKQCIGNIDVALGRVGASLSEVVRTRMFVTDIEADWEAIGRAHAEAFGDLRPATTMVQVQRLIAPWMKVEIEADALIGSAEQIREAPAYRFCRATPTMTPAIEALLDRAALPVPEGDERVHFWIATDEQDVVGCAGVQMVGDDALLRSVAVDARHRHRGVASSLLDLVLVELRQQGVHHAFALSIDTTAVFTPFGFRPISRRSAPPLLQTTAQMRQEACQPATLLRAQL